MRWLLALILSLTAFAATAQDGPALLVADVVRTDGDVLVAEGNVQALYDGATLTATRITYDAATEVLTIEGPLRLEDGGNVILLADSAELDRDFRNGLLRSARMVLDEQLQLAAVRADRVNGRYTQLTRAAVTSCQVCGPNDVPLWQIRARRVIHDQAERQIYIDQAVLELGGVPVFYLPRLRLPDPTLERAQGFLVPELTSSSQLGLGLKLPYFIPIGDHQDVTLIPHVSRATRTLGFRYRRAFARGGLEVNGAVSQDDLGDDALRGYLFADAELGLGRDWQLEFHAEMVTDDSYLSDYDVSSTDRLESRLVLSRTRRLSYTEAALYHFESLRDGETNATQPTIAGDLVYETRHHPARLGGELRLGLETHSHYRYSDSPVDGPDDDLIPDGRDVARTTVQADWRRRWTLGPGLRLGAQTGIAVDAFTIRQDAAAEGRTLHVTPMAALELRYPLVRTGASGARHLLEPMAQLAFVGGSRGDQPNDESTRVEFDQGNLLALSRFPAPDRREHGLMGAVGLRWTRHAPGGWSAGLTFGQVFRSEADAAFSRSSGLGETSSDLLVAGQLKLQNGLSLTGRGLMALDSGVTKAEARAAWSGKKIDLAAAFLLLKTDLDEDRPRRVSEWSFDTGYRFAPSWTATAQARYDLATDRLARAGVGLEYSNECIAVDFSARRKYARTGSDETDTTYGLTVALKGFSTGGSASDVRRVCR
ncbi:LPS-assembly protein LptD [Mesobacterium pallidum]|uniref:LPS-assembly protein LptD n=1 Tax=Mesobacterium pallidum TaxID=2872037 RepID=UPI001EE1E6DC|nr:LPS assembly protein LptD [Mesobacterium pallidum]